MKNILLTTTALVALAGAAVAEGHTSLTFTGKVTAGVAREGGAAEVAATITTEEQDTAIADYAAAVSASTVVSTPATTTVADASADVASSIASLNNDSVVTPSNKPANDSEIALFQSVLDILSVGAGTAAVATGDMETYAEFSGTVVGSVEANGLTISGAISIDAGTGYDFADDDGFDGAKDNGVSLDYVKVDGGAMGVLTLDKNDVAHLVDGDDDASGDVKYTNDFGTASVALVFDTAADTDVTAASAVAASNTSVATPTGAEGEVTYAAAVEEVAADVQWSVKVSAPIGEAATVYAAFDEEKGNAFGGTYAISGVTVSLDSKLEALDAAISADRSNTLGATFVSGAVTVGASFNTIKDGNQWSLNGAYAQDGMSFGFKTNEAEKWTATAGYELSDAASIEAGVNYTEDAYAGLSFKF